MIMIMRDTTVVWLINIFIKNLTAKRLSNNYRKYTLALKSKEKKFKIMLTIKNQTYEPCHKVISYNKGKKITIVSKS